jgi:hypothetical protein
MPSLRVMPSLRHPVTDQTRTELINMPIHIDSQNEQTAAKEVCRFPLKSTIMRR